MHTDEGDSDSEAQKEKQNSCNVVWEVRMLCWHGYHSGEIVLTSCSSLPLVPTLQVIRIEVHKHVPTHPKSPFLCWWKGLSTRSMLLLMLSKLNERRSNVYVVMEAANSYTLVVERVGKQRSIGTGFLHM